MLDLCKMFGVEEGEEFKFCEYGDIYFIQNGYLYFIDIDSIEKKSYLNINDVAGKNIIKLPKKKEFSQETLNLFKLVDKTYKWVAKDMNENVYAYEEKPRKGSTYWLYGKGIKCGAISNCFNQSIFDQIHWEDEEPVFIDDYVDRENEED